MAQDLSMLERFASTIEKLPINTFTRTTSLPDELLLERSGSLTVHYTPFDYINYGARVVIVGITPGIQQANNACKALNESLRRGETSEQAARAAKHSGAFSGPMRNNLVAMLDEIGLPRLLGIRSTSSLWGSDSALVHTTSILRYPVLVAGKNYNGSPAIERHQMLERWFRATFATEVAKLTDAVIVPLGPKVEAQVARLVQEGVVRSSRVLTGIPHPSGANAERIAYFLGRKSRESLSEKTNANKLDDALNVLKAKVTALSSASPGVML